MSQAIDNIFIFPDSCLIKQPITRKQFNENSSLTAGDRRLLRNCVAEIICSYLLDSEHGVVLTPDSDEEHDYTCLVQVDVFLKKRDGIQRLAELFHRAMPHPLIILFHNEESLLFSVAEKRFSRDGKESVVLERIVNTEWWQETHLTDFLTAADFTKDRSLCFRRLYQRYMMLLEVLKCASITGTFTISGLTPEERHRLLGEWQQLKAQFSSIQSEAKRESVLARQIELNLQAQKLSKQISEIEKQLSQSK